MQIHLAPSTTAFLLRRVWAAVAVAVFLATAAAGSAASPVRLRWDELGTLSGKTVRIVAAGGTILTGKVKGIDAGALLLELKETTDPKAYPKGPTRIERSGALRLDLQTKRALYRVIGTTVGSIVGLVGGAVCAILVSGGIFSNDHQGAAAATFIGIWGGGTVGGYLLGNAADKRWTPVEIIP